MTSPKKISSNAPKAAELVNKLPEAHNYGHKELFTFSGWKETLLERIPLDLHPCICNYLSRGEVKPTLKQTYGFDTKFTARTIPETDHVVGFKKPSLSNPCGATLQPSTGRIFVADTSHNRLMIYEPNGKWIREVTAAYSSPTGMAFDFDNNLVIVEEGANNRIQILDSTTFECIRMFGKKGEGNGEFNRPRNVAVDPEGNLVVTDNQNNRVQVFQPDGTWIRKFGELGTEPGQMRHPVGVAVATNGDIIVCENGNNRIQVFDPVGKSKLIFGESGGPSMQIPWGISVDRNGLVVICDQANHRMQIWSSITGTHVAQFGTRMEADRDEHEVPGFSRPLSVMIDSKGNIIVADSQRLMKFGKQEKNK